MIQLFVLFFRIGLFSFGGGLAMLPLIFQSVSSFHIMDRQTFSDLVALSQVTPGPVAVNAATFVGLKNAGIAGAAVATLGVSLPSFLIMLAVMRVMDRYYHSLAVQGMLRGIRPVVVGLIAAAGVMVAETTFSFAWNAENLLMAGIAVTVAVLSGKTRIHPVWMMLAAGAVGACLL